MLRTACFVNTLSLNPPRNAEAAGLPHNDTLPVLEVITAIVASFNSPDLATIPGKSRCV